MGQDDTFRCPRGSARRHHECIARFDRFVHLHCSPDLGLGVPVEPLVDRERGIAPIPYSLQLGNERWAAWLIDRDEARHQSASGSWRG